ncbi:hypothetical protein BD779DRAFT_1388861, partial [Infundibulicybe gibba]
MFTPPPSPLPARRNGSPSSEMSMEMPHIHDGDYFSPHAEHISCPQEMKRRSGRRLKWAIVLVPLAMILITASTRYLSHPAAFDIFSGPSAYLSWENLASKGTDWRLHRRHPEPQAKGSSPTSTTMASSVSPSPSTTSQSDQPLPSIPSAPPPLPTPFPQPFDSDIQQNFSSMSCFNFFSNMTNSASFRSCRPLSCLLQSSSTFINAQQNLTLLNTIVWGTCNTTTAESQCISNMNAYATALKAACVQDLADDNAMAEQTLIALQAYSVGRDGGCLANPTTNTYCYLSAVRDPNPSDLYFYQLPLGIKLPPSSTPSCSSCTQSLLKVYAAALKNGSQSDSLTGLKQTYGSAAQLAVQKCGSGYADT